MLVLSRKIGQKIVIGKSITITVNRLDDSKVSLGINAPRDIPVVRMELLNRTKNCVKPELSSHP